MNSEVLDTRGKILSAAIDILGQKGDFTIREITEKAGVNVASINYYFGNKNSLLKEVENYYSGILYRIQYEILRNESLTPYEKLFKWAKSLIEFILERPAIITLIVSVVNEEKDYKPLLIEKIYLNKDIQVAIQTIIRDSTGIEDEKILGYKFLQIFSGVLGPVISKLVSDTFGEGESVFNISKTQDLDEYIAMFMKSVLGK